MKLEEIAKACHAMNLQYCRIIGDPIVMWDDNSADIRGSVICAVENAIEGTTPELSHEKWLKDRLSMGWNNNLPANQKAKDKIFLAVVEGLK